MLCDHAFASGRTDRILLHTQPPNAGSNAIARALGGRVVDHPTMHDRGGNAHAGVLYEITPAG